MRYILPALFAVLVFSSAFAGEPPYYKYGVTKIIVGPESTLRIESPKDGAEVTSPFAVNAAGIAVEGVPQAGAKSNMWRLHLYVDTDVKVGDVDVVADEQHVDFGSGRTETVVKLKPGKYTLRAVVTHDNNKLAPVPVMSEMISVTVKEPEEKK